MNYLEKNDSLNSREYDWNMQNWSQLKCFHKQLSVKEGDGWLRMSTMIACFSVYTRVNVSIVKLLTRTTLSPTSK